jgi:hypothetical protein
MCRRRVRRRKKSLSVYSLLNVIYDRQPQFYLLEHKMAHKKLLDKDLNKAVKKKSCEGELREKKS